MNKKITISELSQLLSTNVTLINKKGWEDFLRIFFAQISEGLQAEGNVKIKGLGTFKVVTVDARKSKDVNTGANTIIPAHNKISFTPDSALAETLNKPYAHFEPTYVLSPNGDVDAPENEDDDDATADNSNVEAANNIANIAQTSAIASETIPTSKEDTVQKPTEVETEPVQTTEKEPEIKEETKVVEEEPVIIANTETEDVKEEVAEEKPTSDSEVTNSETPNSEEIAKTETTEDGTFNAPIEEPKQEVAAEDETNVSDEDPEITDEEDTTADEDENIDTNPTEIKQYAAIVKRHDLPNEDEDVDDKNGRGKKLGIAIILFLCILAVVGLVAWLSDPNIVQNIRAKISGREPARTEVVKIDTIEKDEIKEYEEQLIATKSEENVEIINETVSSIENDNDEIEEPVKPAQSEKSQKFTNFKDDFVNYMKKKHPEMDITDQGDAIDEKLGTNSRLTLVSLRHYGAKDFWVYIYLYNKDVIKNPNHIKAGTNIKIPKLDNEKLVNPDSEHSILTAKEIQHEFVK